MKLLRDFEEYLGNDTFKVFDDFHYYIKDDLWTNTDTDDGGVTVSDAVAGVAVLACGPAAEQSANDETYLHTSKELFKFATDKPLLFACRVKPKATTIASTGYIIGLKDAVAANALQDDTTGPADSYSGAVFFTDDTLTDWRCESSITTTQTTTATGHTIGNNAWDILVIRTMPISSTTTEVHFYSADYQTDGSYSLDEVGLTTPTGTQQFVAHTLTHTSATEMELCLGVKGGATNDKAKLEVDWVYCAQKR